METWPQELKLGKKPGSVYSLTEMFRMIPRISYGGTSSHHFLPNGRKYYESVEVRLEQLVYPPETKPGLGLAH